MPPYYDIQGETTYNEDGSVTYHVQRKVGAMVVSDPHENFHVELNDRCILRSHKLLEDSNGNEYRVIDYMGIYISGKGVMPYIRTNPIPAKGTILFPKK